MRYFATLMALSTLSGGLPVHAAGPDFVHEVVPVLKEHCAECHTGDKKKGGLSMNTRASLLAGGENGAVVVPGQAAKSKLVELVTTADKDDRMPPKGPPVSPEKIALLKAWIDGGLEWDPAFAFKKPAYEPPLRPRRPAIPAPSARDRTHPIDCLLDHCLATNGVKRPGPIDDGAFLRRVSLDVTGLLPTTERLEAFRRDTSGDKRAKVIAELLADETAYAEHWLTFWNDLLRNDYAGTGYIDGGRKQISAWLYRALAENKPYDQFARELLAPSPDSEGFSRGIKWRGQVSAGQSVPVQFAQSVGQSFLGINLKCASCHDSFVDRWKLAEAYGLAAVYSAEPLELYRCDKPTGKMAQAAWLFPELGTIDASKPPAERMKQLAALMTDPQNGRFSRAIVNRIWHRLMGRGIVHPVDSMQGPPWNADLLDHLATRFVDDGYDLKKLIAYICASQAYQSKSEVIADDGGNAPYHYAGPRARRLTAEQFVDAVWQLTGTAPAKFDAPIGRRSGNANAVVATNVTPTGRWIWSVASPAPEAGATVTFRKTIDLPFKPATASAVVTVDNGYALFVNGRKAGAGTDWTQPDAVELSGFLRKGANDLLVIATNGGESPNAAAVWFEARIRAADGKEKIVASDASWQWTAGRPDAKGRFAAEVTDWKPAVEMPDQNGWRGAMDEVERLLAGAGSGSRMVRASLMKADLLQRALGRPNREQIVSMRPNDLTTLEAMDLNNGRILDDWLSRGAKQIVAKGLESPDAFANWLYRYALSREPTAGELALARETLGAKPAAAQVQDLVWAVLMLPEFQLVR